MRHGAQLESEEGTGAAHGQRLRSTTQSETHLGQDKAPTVRVSECFCGHMPSPHGRLKPRSEALCIRCRRRGRWCSTTVHVAIQRPDSLLSHRPSAP
jgi:hypothetical protein